MLRGVGLAVPTGSVVAYLDALRAVGLHRPDHVYWAGRATLLAAPEDAAAYDRAFATFWLGQPPAVDEVIVTEVTAVVDEGDAGGVRYSAAEVLRHKDFAAYSHEEFAEARRLMADLRLVGALQRTRRRRRSRRAIGHPDMRRTVRRALRTGGEPIHRAFLEPSMRPRRVVLLCDVSGSMDPYARALLRFLHAAVAGPTRVEAFALGTRLTRLSRELSGRDPDAALAAAARAVADWSGGTRLGAGCARSTTAGACGAWRAGPSS